MWHEAQLVTEKTIKMTVKQKHSIEKFCLGLFRQRIIFK